VGIFGLLTEFDKYRATMNAFLAKHTYHQLTPRQQKQIDEHTLLLMKRSKFTLSDTMPGLTELERYSFYALGMYELGIAPAIANEAWSIVDNPLLALQNPEYKVNVVKDYFIKTYNVEIDMDWESSSAYQLEQLKASGKDYNRGLASIHSGEYQQAINDFNKAIEIYPHFAAAYINRGGAHYKLGNHQQAINDFNKAIEIDPKLAEAYFGRGNVFFKLGSYRQTLNDYNKALELNPKFIHAYINRGNVYVKLGDRDIAIRNYKMAAQLGDINSQKHLSLHGIEWR
jgi:tetratricopeptide (TPR) repeat protein